MGRDDGELPRDVASQVAANDRGPSRVFLHEASDIENESINDDPTVRFLVVAGDLFGPKYRERSPTIERRRPRLGQRRRPNRSVRSEMATFSSAATVFQVSWRTWRSWPLVDWFLPTRVAIPR